MPNILSAAQVEEIEAEAKRGAAIDLLLCQDICENSVPALIATARHFAELLKETMGDAMVCTCHDDYIRRNLIAPDCRYHDNLDQVAALAAWEKRDDSA